MPGSCSTSATIYPQRMTDLSLLGFVEEMQKRFAEAAHADRD